VDLEGFNNQILIYKKKIEKGKRFEFVLDIEDEANKLNQF
jgi:hypothetical protein